MQRMNSLIPVAALVALPVMHSLAVAEPVPEPWNLKARKAFAAERFGIFLHWGLYSNYAQGEWYLQTHKLDEDAYARMMYGFCPSKFDAREWVRVFKNAGAKYVTITARHHEGFSLWPTKVDDGYNIANTPFKRDILGELAAACKEAGLQLNFYYSLLDWHRKDYPAGFVTSNVKVRDRKPDYASYKKFMMGQITELIDNYHPGYIWFDGEWDHHFRDDKGELGRTLDWGLDEIFDLIHSKHVLVANNSHQASRPKEDIQAFERDLPGENSAGYSESITVKTDRPLEQCDVLQNGIWGYRIGEGSFRTSEEVVAMVARAASKNANLLMNIGPDGSGQLPEQAVAVMAKVGAWFAKNGESIYGTVPGGVADGKDIVSTRKGGTFYLHFLNPEKKSITFKPQGTVTSVRNLATGKPVAFEVAADGALTVTVERAAGDGFDAVVEVK